MRDGSRDGGQVEVDGRGAGRPGPSHGDALRAPAPAPRQWPPTTAAGVLALQRTAGNTAVARALSTRRHAAGGAGHTCEEGPAHHGGRTPDAVVQRTRGEYPSARVLRRLHLANDAIRRVRADTRHAANQQSALIHTVCNSSLRAVVQQHDGFSSTRTPRSGW